MIIFDCNGVLVDSELLAASVAVEEFRQVGFSLTSEVVLRFFTGRRPADMFAEIEAATGRKLPSSFGANLSKATLKKFRQELQPMSHVAQALRWLRGPKCVASSSNLDRVRVSLESTDLMQFFGSNIFSASKVQHGKPAPDLFLHVAHNMRVAPSTCIVVEDSVAGVSAAYRAGMTTIGFIGGSNAGLTTRENLIAAGARIVIGDMRVLYRAVVSLRGW